jgi:cell wall-associated NlpC family hydrolase
VRNTLYIIGLICLCTSCGIFRHSGSATPASGSPEGRPSIHTAASRPARDISRERITGSPMASPPGYAYRNAKGLNIESLDETAFKYAMQLDVPVELISDLPLYHFIDEWIGTPYHLGGNGKDGVDCSGFTKILEQTIFSLDLPRTSSEQYQQCHKVPVQELQEGDLVFFGTKKGITHVGVYLAGNKFVHASTSFGVMISDLGEPYWVRRFRGGGRMPG